jgi:alkyl sulfatase BDS1-like metallo-beta-lactamase superfamily hydrolase
MTARNYYLTQALEVEGKLHIGMMKIPDKSLLKKLQVADIFSAMAVKLNPEKSIDVRRSRCSLFQPLEVLYEETGVRGRINLINSINQQTL